MATLSKHATLYLPSADSKAVGVVQIVHGMCEHQKRYKPLADFLNENNYIVITSDLRGHGDNVTRDQEYGYFGDNGTTNLINDIHEITLYVKSEYPDLPYFLLGHSMGTLISTCYMKRYDNYLDGLILSGMPGSNNMVSFAKKLVRFLATIKGEFYRSDFVNGLMNGPFEKPFKDEGSKFAWLSKNKANVRAYETDSKCGFVFTLNGFYTLTDLMEETYKKASFIMKNPALPIILLSGEDDPCMGDKKNFMNSVNLFKDAGYKNVQYVLYPGMRHEIFNDNDKDKAREDVLAALDIITNMKTVKKKNL